MNDRVIFAFIGVFLFSIGLGSHAFSETMSASGSEDFAQVNDNTQVTLSGLKSSDPQDFPLSYNWAQVSGDPVSISSPTAPTITFTTPTVEAGNTKTLVFSLTVDNSHSGRSTTTFTLQVVHDDPPVVTTQHELIVPELSQVFLVGSGSDPNGDVITYSWKQTSGDDVMLSSPDQQTTSFIAPAVKTGETKVLTFTLTGADPLGLQDSDNVKVTVFKVTPVNVSCPPLQKAMPGQSITISPDIDNPYNAALTYSWKQGAGDKIPGLVTNQKDLSFTVPTFVHGYELSFMLNIYEGSIPVANCESYIYFSYLGEYPITSQSNEKREFTVANAGYDQTVPELTNVILDGSFSVGKKLTYSWIQTSGAQVTLVGSDTVHPSFIAPHVNKGTQKDLVFRLTVSNGLEAKSDTVKITVYNPADPPTARITLQ